MKIGEAMELICCDVTMVLISGVGWFYGWFYCGCIFVLIFDGVWISLVVCKGNPVSLPWMDYGREGIRLRLVLP